MITRRRVYLAPNPIAIAFFGLVGVRSMRAHRYCANRRAVAFTVKQSVKRSDVEYWAEERALRAALTKDGKRIYGVDLEEDKRYEIVERS